MTTALVVLFVWFLVAWVCAVAFFRGAADADRRRDERERER